MTKLVRPLYGEDGSIVKAIGPAETRAELRELVAHRSNHDRSFRLGAVTDARTVNPSLYHRPSSGVGPDWL